MAKRGQNEGSIYRRQDGRWAAVVNLGYAGGKRKRKTFYGDTRREVQQQLTKALRDQQQGLPVAFPRQTVAQFLEQWLRDSAKPSVRPKTYVSYEAIVRLHLVPELGSIQLSALTAPQVQSLLNKKIADGFSPHTVRRIHAALRRALGQALRWDFVARNVATLVSPPRVEQDEVHFLDQEEARAFLKAIKGDRLEALYTVALALGLRKGEALALQWRDVDLDGATLRVHATLQRLNGKLQLVEPKTRSSKRTIDLPDILVTALRAHRVRQLEERLLAGTMWQDTGFVFTSSVGTPLDERNVTRQFQRMLVQAQLPHMRFHDLRHSCATLLLAQGVTLNMVAEILGHSRVSTTTDIYGHVTKAQRTEAARRMNAALTGGA
jgi:integrase